MADIRLTESNGAGPTVTPGVEHLDQGSADQAELVRGTFPLHPGTKAYFKIFRVELVSITGILGIETLRIYMDGSYGAGITDKFNLSTSQSTYDSANHKRTTYLQPSNTDYTALPETTPTADPLTANLGIGGSLTGQLTAPGFSDYALLGLDVGAGRNTPGNLQLIVGHDTIL